MVEELHTSIRWKQASHSLSKCDHLNQEAVIVQKLNYPVFKVHITHSNLPERFSRSANGELETRCFPVLRGIQAAVTSNIVTVHACLGFEKYLCMYVCINVYIPCFDKGNASSF